MFKNALTHTLPFEGGYVNDPDDMGGETNYGITKKTALAHGYTGPMKDIPMSKVEEIYKKSYWDINKLDDVNAVNPALALEMFDAGVNCGVSRAGKWLQMGLNLMNRNQTSWPNISEDGQVGAGTVATLKKVPKDDMDMLYMVVKCLRGNHYLDLCTAKEVQEKYLRGWMKRLK